LERTGDEHDDIQPHRGIYKKLYEEVIQITQGLVLQGREQHYVQFPLDSNPPDAWLLLEVTKQRVGIEATMALGKAGYFLGKELVEKGEGRGFLELQDDDEDSEFILAMRGEGEAYSPEEAFRTVVSGVERCLGRKGDPVRYRGMILLIAAPLWWLPRDSWMELPQAVARIVSESPFDEIYVASYEYDDLVMPMK
jgi:hypothetical protein